MSSDHTRVCKLEVAICNLFTEHGAVMAASVLNTPVAVSASIEVVRAFVRLRHLVASQSELTRKLADLEAKLTDHDQKLVVVFDAIRQLMMPPVSPRRPNRLPRSPGEIPKKKRFPEKDA